MIWKPIPGLRGRYEASDSGLIRSVIAEPRVLAMHTSNATGHLSVHVRARAGGPSRTVYVHQLVAYAFLGPRPIGQEVRHLDGVASNNRPSNLIYGTRSQNKRDEVAHGRHWNAGKTHCAHGHPYSPENTYRPPGRPTLRLCRTCRSRWHRNYAAKRRTTHTIPTRGDHSHD